MKPPPTPPLTARRPEWLRVLARAQAAELQQLAAPALADHRFETLRPAEPGLIMVRARIGNSGDRFNLGEATVTRCAVRLLDRDGASRIGVGHVLGRDRPRAETIARADALLQCASLHALLWQELIEPLRRLRAQRDAQQQTRTADSRVRFFTLQAEATP